MKTKLLIVLLNKHKNKNYSKAPENKGIFNKTLKTATAEAFLMSSGRLF